jgi:hypothetical protein
MRDNRDLISDMENDLSSKLQSKADLIISTIVSEASGIPDEWDKDGDLITDLLIATGLKDNKTNRGTMEPAVRKVAKRCANGVVTTTTAVYIPRETLDRTIGMIRDLHDKMIKNSESEFKAEPRIDCDDCQYCQVCTCEKLVIEEDDIHD